MAEPHSASYTPPMSSAVSSPPTCARCGSILAPADLACSACGLLVHVNELQELSHQAQWLEARDRLAAAAVWRRCLELLPSESPQAGMVAARIASLEQTRMSPVARTGLSMLMSIAVYGFIFRMDYGNALGFVFAAGFILLILVHEMGHVMALRSYGIPGSPPTFIPFVGAVISVPPMRNALEEAVVGISGPVLGTIGALTCFAVYRITHINMLLDLSFYGILINLLNLLPIPPLDGGRVTAAISPWLWMLGLVGLVAKFLYDWQAGQRDYIL